MSSESFFDYFFPTALLGTSAAVGCFQSLDKTPPPPPTRPHLLGLDLQVVEGLALRPRRRPAGHRRVLAPAWLQAVLAMEVETQRPAQSQSEVRALIRLISRENPLWGAPRIQAEPALLGHEVAESTVATYMVRRRPGPPSQTWRSFLKNHMNCTAACDFFVVPTATFRLLYCFVILAHGRRRIVHFNVSLHPSEDWTAQQIVEAFPADGSEPNYLIRDRDSIYGGYFRHRLKNLRIREVLISPRSPWQNPGVRPHNSLNGNSPLGREIEPPSKGRVVAIREVGGLHHRYTRAA